MPATSAPILALVARLPIAHRVWHERLACLPVERVVRRIRHAQECAGGLAWTIGNAAFGVESLDRGDIRKQAAAALRDHVELQQRDVFGTCAGSAPGELADNG